MSVEQVGVHQVGEGGAPARCRNCSTVLQPAYEFCPHCGQETHDEPPRFLEFVHEFITHYVALEGRLWKSLWLLLVSPGQLTLEYLAGRKNRYVWPLRLFLTLSFVFFLTLKLLPSTEPLVETDTSTAAAAAAAAASTAASAQAAGGPNKLKLRLLDSDRLPEALSQRLARFEARMESNPSQELERIGQAFYDRLPTLILLFQPLFAALLALLFMSRRMPYGAHFVFALHLHAFWYLCLWLAWVLPFPLVHFCLWVWSNLYAVLALKRVYGGGWPGTLARAGGLAALHCLGLGALLIGQLTLAAIT
jgi:hypothetical protein